MWLATKVTVREMIFIPFRLSVIKKLFVNNIGRNSLNILEEYAKGIFSER
jgi:hypothetical protein